MKLLIIFLSAFAASLANAETINCTPEPETGYVSLEIFKPDLNFDVPWYSAKLDKEISGPNTRPFKQRLNFSVFQTSRGNNLLYVSRTNRSEFSLNLGAYSSHGHYGDAKLVLDKGSRLEQTISMMCMVLGQIEFKNQCQEKPQDLLFDGALNRDVELLESALSCGIDANATNKYGCTPLLLIADNFCGQKLPSPISYTPATLPALPLVDALTNNGAMLEAKDPISDERALHKFVKIGDLDTVSLLLDLEAEVDAQDSKGFTPMMRAVERNDKWLVLRILEANPDLDIKNNKNETAFLIAQNLGLKKLEIYLQNPSSVIEIVGQLDDTCKSDPIEIEVGKVSRFVLKASDQKMFMLTAPDLGLSLMADQGGMAQQNIIPSRKGEYEFTCGVHGGSQQTVGKITVK